MKSCLDKYRLLTFLGLFWIGLEILGILLAMAGLFYKEILLIYSVAGTLICLFVLFKNTQILWQNFKFLPIALVSLLLIIALSYHTTPTVFSGRDQGSFSEAAIRLSQNHSLTFSSPASREFFGIYGPGRALNFPGFDYTKDGNLITNFPLGYSVWLAIFYSIFGLNGFIVANGITLFIFLLCFFLIARFYLNPANAVWAWILTLTSFSFSWFFKFTLSENLALALIWFGVWEFLLFLKEEDKFYLFAYAMTFFALAFTRIESWALLAMAIIILYLKYKKFSVIKEKILNKKIIAMLLLMLVLFLISLKINLPFYRSFAKGFLSAFTPSANETGASSYSINFIAYLFKVLGIYSILNYLVLFLFCAIFLVKSKRYEMLNVALISLPVLIYLVNPSISSDHPWMLRRFVFVVLPLAILYSVIFLEKFFREYAIRFAILLFLLATNLVVFSVYFPASEDNDLLDQTSRLSQNFKQSDLVLIDREATGNGWNMISGPMSFLYGKQAVYFFNPNDIDKISTDKFENVYLIIPEKNMGFYKNSVLAQRLTLKKEYEIETNILNIPAGRKNDLYNAPIEFPKLIDTITQGGIYQVSKN